MRRYLVMFTLILLGFSCMLGLPRHSIAQEIVRAKIGGQLRVGEKTVRAKSRDRIRAGDDFRLYIIPEQDVHVYLIYSDTTTATLVKQLAAEHLEPIVLPAPPDVYQVDDASPKALFTLICSTREIPEVTAFFNVPNVSHQSWKQFEDQLVKQSKIELSQVQPKPFAIAGNVRAESGLDLTNPGHQTHREGDRVAVPILVEKAPTTALVFKATQLPPGLSIDATTGLISGTIASGATARSPYQVKVSVSHDTGNVQMVFAWSVEPDPFFKQLQLFSGKSFLVRKYEFRVKK